MRKNNWNYNKFLHEILNISTHYCGEEYKRNFLKLKAQREKYLSYEWSAISLPFKNYETLKAGYREIDFISLITEASVILDSKKYIEMLL
ncbi:MAG: hypothetical protein ACE5QV_09855, partial [Fidelibacterota bacterium]